MALTTCSECGSPISELATSCPKCGFPLPAKPAASSPQKKLWPFVAIALGLAAAGYALRDQVPTKENKARAALALVLNDPSSARIDEVQPGLAPDSICGSVNAKNRMGAYVGATPFLVVGDTALIYEGSAKDSDFEGLIIFSGSGFAERYTNIVRQCKATDRFKEVCGFNLPTSEWCAKMDEKDFIKQLHARYRRGY